MVSCSFAIKAKEVFKRVEFSTLIDYLDHETTLILKGHQLDEIDRIGFLKEFELVTEDLNPETLEGLVMLRIYFNNFIGGTIKVSDQQQVQFDILINRFQECTQNVIAHRLSPYDPRSHS